MTIINRYLRTEFKGLGALAASVMLSAGGAATAVAQDASMSATNLTEMATYADMVDLAERSDLVIRAEIRRQNEVSAERAPGLQPGFARLYIEADTLALIAGDTAIGESLVYLVDVPRDAKGKAPRLKKQEVILFANALPGRPATKRGREIQLTAENAQLEYSPAFEARLRPVLASLAQADTPPVIDGIADALAVRGTLTGESETQIFLDTQDNSPVSLTVLRRPGQTPVWGVSWGEIIDAAARSPEPQTLRWYRLACSLPAELPSSANLARDPAARRLAAEDYAFVMDQLGRCDRAITD
ncbi:hypothetical protein [Erythrobacter ani]|uniref:DUF2066 domain-containing protein n=1 Tax=Erythrobacter ani TaxID=2827235 RepID=A0ABS6SL96_9SPHN|nr:hypothetical protein [Erythrobacter ani]MBV7265756.1 hypothetical protein [Erythrobacter ani]